ncbi:SLAP domain-containing protein [Lactobacillus helveticus]|nr:SLAP domain-containing protein [Lactobacillus helveticus]
MIHPYTNYFTVSNEITIKGQKYYALNATQYILAKDIE